MDSLIHLVLSVKNFVKLFDDQLFIYLVLIFLCVLLKYFIKFLIDFIDAFKFFIDLLNALISLRALLIDGVLNYLVVGHHLALKRLELIHDQLNQLHGRFLTF